MNNGFVATYTYVCICEIKLPSNYIKVTHPPHYPQVFLLEYCGVQIKEKVQKGYIRLWLKF